METALPASDQPSGQPPGRDAAEAIHNLSPKELKALLAYANWRLLGKYGTLHGYSGEDLSQAAIVLTLDGTRKWNPDVSIKTHLRGCIESLADGVRRKSARETAIDEGTLVKSPAFPYGYELSPVTRMEILGFLHDIKSHLHNETEKNIFDLRQEGHTAGEIKRILHLEEDVYKAAAKAIYRATSRERLKRYGK